MFSIGFFPVIAGIAVSNFRLYSTHSESTAAVGHILLDNIYGIENISLKNKSPSPLIIQQYSIRHCS